MKLTKAERETIINFDDEVKIANIYTFDIRLKNRLSKLHKERPDECKLVKNSEVGYVEYDLPKKWLKLVSTRRLSEKQNETLEKMRSKLKINQK